MAFKFNYDAEHDILYICDADKKVEESFEFSEDIILDLNDKGGVIGVELFYASELFKPFNKEISKEFLSKLEDAELEYKDFRNMWFVALSLKSGSKKISQVLPPLKKSEYTSPLIADDF